MTCIEDKRVLLRVVRVPVKKPVEVPDFYFHHCDHVKICCEISSQSQFEEGWKSFAGGLPLGTNFHHKNQRRLLKKV